MKENTLMNEKELKAVEIKIKAKKLELKEISKKLKDSKKTLQNLNTNCMSKNLLDAYCQVDMFGNVQKMNNEASRLLSFNGNNTKINFLSLVHKDDLSLTLDVYDQLLRDGSFKNYKCRLVLKDKSVKKFHINASLLYDSNGKPDGIQGIARDITNDEFLNEQLVKSENRFKMILEHFDSAILLEDENRNITLVNKKFCDLFTPKSDSKSLIGKNCVAAAEQAKLLFKNSEDFMSQINSLTSNKKESLSEVLVMLDGTVLERDYIPVYNDNEFRGHLWSYKNVTAEKVAQQNLVESEKNLKTLIQNLDHGIFLEDENGIGVLANKKLCELFHMPMSPE
ncbi:PAS domain-containing protein [uncultured Polaribacter sp.]|uniref:PAS domain-containing protein n=1 Tax=uncultured Polaribacter sp. TaxID=174711 RepID=UPI002627A513|nr:PAS domain-containing protein [uncultured Polaribacter sp.]